MKKQSQKKNASNKNIINENKDKLVIGSSCHIGVEATIKRLIKNFPKT
jgi:hypothetical protein